MRCCTMAAPWPHALHTFAQTPRLAMARAFIPLQKRSSSVLDDMWTSQHLSQLLVTCPYCGSAAASQGLVIVHASSILGVYHGHLRCTKRANQSMQGPHRPTYAAYSLYRHAQLCYGLTHAGEKVPPLQGCLNVTVEKDKSTIGNPQEHEV